MTTPFHEQTADELIGKLAELKLECNCLKDDYDVLCSQIRRKFDAEHEYLNLKISQCQAALSKFTNN